jgi:hypothetical protein
MLTGFLNILMIRIWIMKMISRFSSFVGVLFVFVVLGFELGTWLLLNKH